MYILKVIMSEKSSVMRFYPYQLYQYMRQIQYLILKIKMKIVFSELRFDSLSEFGHKTDRIFCGISEPILNQKIFYYITHILQSCAFPAISIIEN
jgi:hypothetical protein